MFYKIIYRYLYFCSIIYHEKKLALIVKILFSFNTSKLLDIKLFQWIFHETFNSFDYFQTR